MAIVASGVMDYHYGVVYTKFEDIPVWQESRQLVSRVYGLINTNKNIGRDFELAGQLKRATYSVMLNIAEGFERSSNAEFAHFLNIAKGSAGEVRSILYIIEDNLSGLKEPVKPIYNDVLKLSTHIAGFRKFLLTDKSRRK